MSAAAPRAVVTGCGLVSPLAGDRQRLLAALAAGQSGLGPPRRLAAAAPAPLPAGIQVGEIEDFHPQRDLGEEANLRPLDRTAQLLTVAAARALADCALGDGDRAAAGLAVGTAWGSLSTISEFDRRQLTAGPRYVKPLDFANTVINAAAGQAAIWFGLEGLNATFGGGASAGLEALAFAADQVRGGRVPLVLAGGAEELGPEAVLAFACAGLLAGGNGAPARPRPFAADRNGLALGEGAALLAVEEEGHARDRGAAVRAWIAGFGSAFGDDERTVERAVGAALADAGLDAADLDVWVASANGSPGLDRREAWGVWRALDGALPPVAAPKAGLGEALGAGGALAAATLLAILESGTLPGLAGVSDDGDLPPLAASAAPRMIEARTLAARYGLVTAVGLDGDAAALILARGDQR